MHRLSSSVWTEPLRFLSHAKGEGLFRPESMVTKEEHAIPWNCFGPVTWEACARVLNRTSQRPHLWGFRSTQDSGFEEASSRSVIAVANVAFINRIPNQFKLSSSKISWCVGETWFSPYHLSQLQSPESLMLRLFLSWLWKPLKV